MSFDTIDTVATCAKIVTYMKQLGLKPKDVARKLGLTNAQAVYKWMHGAQGKNKNMPSFENMVALAQLFNVTLDELVVKKEFDIYD